MGSAPFFEVGACYGAAYAAFSIMTVLGLLKVVIGIFVQRSKQIDRADIEVALDEARASREANIRRLRELFDTIDKEGRGLVCYADIEDNPARDRIRRFFDHFQIDYLQANEFFHFLDKDGSGEVDQDEFVEGCVRLQGAAKPLEIAFLQKECKDMHKKLDVVLDKL